MLVILVQVNFNKREIQSSWSKPLSLVEINGKSTQVMLEVEGSKITTTPG